MGHLFEKRNPQVVTAAFKECNEEDGYLVLSVGDVVVVEYIGGGEEEDGWLFGYMKYEPDRRGWFPSSTVDVRRLVDAASDSDFARTATPSDDSKDFQRLVTPPPDDSDAHPSAQWLQPPVPRSAPLGALPSPGLDVPPAAWLLPCVTEGLNTGSHLPMYQFCSQLKSQLLTNRVVLVDAETGSGKSTLVPLCLAQQCLEEGRSARIVVTQPRRIAAKGLAQHVSHQVQQTVGDVIGYRVGGHDKVCRPEALVVYVTVGHFLEALVHNPDHLSTYSHVVLDEVHERFVEADFLMALLRLNLSRPETVRQRIIVMSATLQKRLHEFFQATLLPSPGTTLMASISSPGSTPFRVEDYFYDDLPAGMKTFNKFGELLPSSLQGERNEQVRSDKLTMACKKLTEVAASLILRLEEEGIRVVLAVLPGLDQIQELKNHLDGATYGLEPKCEIIMMHSALDYDQYKSALDPVEEGQWKVVLATNMAESSLTVPGVGAVIDFGMHRVNVYNDEKRMSTLVTTWCSKASLKQRRGRTGRTNDGRYYCMMERRIFEKLEDFDQSGVERTALTKVALEAAYLAQVLEHPGRVRAGLPVICQEQQGLQRRLVDFFDGAVGMWRLRCPEPLWAAEEDLKPEKLHLEDILNLLPSPPSVARVDSALADLQDLGTLNKQEKPTALGIACLKLPTEVALARLVVLGWTLGLGPSACVLAAALTLTPSCDVFRTPMNTREELTTRELKLLKESIKERCGLDQGYLSEPLALHTLCVKWLKGGGGLGQNLHRNSDELLKNQILHSRLWTQFSDKVTDLWRALGRLLPMHDPAQRQLQALQNLARRRTREAEAALAVRALESDPEHLLALLTWSLTPGGFVAVGQSPSLYGKGSYGSFWREVQQKRWDCAQSLHWKLPCEEARLILCHLHTNLHIPYIEHCEQVEDEKECSCVLNLDEPREDRHQAPERFLPETFEFLYRLCSPFNGKANLYNFKVKHAPQHPCAINWYMPCRRDSPSEDIRLMEVALNWKAPAYSLLNGRPRRSTRCRPKRFLVACGGDYRTDYHGDVPIRVPMLRGISVLPARDHGRQALLWLLSAGLPREASMTALCAPAEGLEPENFEVRGLWMWDRTFRMSDEAMISSRDLRAVNAFRASLTRLQQYRPHRLAGKWMDQYQDPFRIDCIDSAEGEVLWLWELNGEDGDVFLGHFVHDGESWISDGQCLLEDGSELLLGERRLRRCTEELAILEQINEQGLKAFHQAAKELLEVSRELPQRRGKWPARFVPLVADTAMSPFNLDMVAELLQDFCQHLEDRAEFYGSASQDEDDEADDDEPYVDKASEDVHKDFMWRLAREKGFDPQDSQYIKLPENSLALPTAAICVMCQEEGKQFSKRQLGRPIWDRVCTDCCNEKQASLQSAVYKKPDKTIFESNAALQPALVPAAQKPKECSKCGQLMTTANSTTTQLSKPSAKRCCQACVQKPEKLEKAVPAG